MDLKVKKLYPDARIPTRQNNGDAGLDLYAHRLISDDLHENPWFGTGVAVEIKRGYVGLVFPRSSLTKSRLYLHNSVGVIDSGYRGEIQVRFSGTNVDAITDNVFYQEGDRVAQLIILPLPIIRPVETDELSDSIRGHGGFGSTGNE